MPSPPTSPPTALDVALKEWDTVCHLLAEGRQILLLRKGGVSDENGVFHLRHRRFLLYPTFVHQRGELLKPRASDAFRPGDETPGRVTLPGWAEVTDVVAADDAAVRRLDPLHCWTDRQVDLRLNYRPEAPTYVALLRAHRLPGGAGIEERADYGGCVSWVPLHGPVGIGGAVPALDDDAYAAKVAEVRAVLAGAA